MFKWPKTRKEFWFAKLQANRNRDRSCEVSLRSMGWRVLTIWECAMKGKGKLSEEAIVEMTIAWLNSESEIGSIEGH